MVAKKKPHDYKVRYSVEEWNKPPERIEDEPCQPGIRRSLDNYGYADHLVLFSIVHQPGGGVSILPICTETKARPSAETFVKLRDFIDHLIESHS